MRVCYVFNLKQAVKQRIDETFMCTHIFLYRTEGFNNRFDYCAMVTQCISNDSIFKRT